jgi:FKBP-type peptidyl-prolyl cis-trans isomerase FkpA
MRSIFSILTFVVLSITFSGCIKGAVSEPCVDKTPSQEAAAMQAYAAAKGYSMTVAPEGYYYQVVDPGSGAIALPTSKIYVKYTGRLISSDAIFDQQADHTQTGWVLSILIRGWQLGIPNIAEGGTIRLIIPSSLAYGCRGFATIPANAVLFFEIELVDIQ